MNAPLATLPRPSMGEVQPHRRYQAMREAISVCATVDDASEIRDQAAALAYYARQRDDTEVLVWMQEIRLRAGRRIGEILRDIERDRGGRPGPQTRLRGGPSLVAQAIRNSGLRRGPAYEMQEIAGPRDVRLRAVADAAAESYFATARDTQHPATKVGLRQAVISAVHAALGPGEIRRMAKDLARDAQAQKALRRARRELDLTDATRAAGASLGARLYAVIYADPPWPHEVWSAETGMDRSAANHYPTMSVEGILALPVPAAPTSGLFLWCPDPLLDVGIDVLRGWGFRYKCSWIWNKPRIGLGFWNRKKHEQLLFGTRGDLPAPSPGSQWPSVIDAALGTHSEKPLDFARMIEACFPTAPKVELFARGPRTGWDVWGNEADGGAA